MSAVLWPAFEQLEALAGVSASSALTGIPRSSVYRWRAADRRPFGPPRAPAPKVMPSALTEAERADVLAVLDSDRFADKAPAQAWAMLLDEGRYLCSVSSMYRILRSAQQVRERRAVATHPPRVKPQLLATGPSQVFSWDITKLKGPVRGVYYSAYVMIDIYSRKIIHAEVHSREDKALARDFIDAAIGANNGIVPNYIHSDNGGPMTSITVEQLLSQLDITRSLSRPKVSNDNPYSEAVFKTVKYCPAFPDDFGSLPDARAFMNDFSSYYNHHHRHSGIGLYTPAAVHDGSWRDQHCARQATLDAAWRDRPDRFPRGRPKAPIVPAKAWINQPPSSIETSTASHTSEAA